MGVRGPKNMVYGPNGEQVTAYNVMLPDEELKANAQAIAALPDLLTAMEQMKPIIEAFLKDELSVTTIREAGDIFHDAYLPALTKAGCTF